MSGQCRQAAWQKRAECACSLLPAHKHALGAAALYTGLRRAVERLSRLTVLATLRACRPAQGHIFVAERKPQSSSRLLRQDIECGAPRSSSAAASLACHTPAGLSRLSLAGVSYGCCRPGQVESMLWWLRSVSADDVAAVSVFGLLGAFGGVAAEPVPEASPRPSKPQPDESRWGLPHRRCGCAPTCGGRARTGGQVTFVVHASALRATLLTSLHTGRSACNQIGQSRLKPPYVAETGFRTQHA